MMARWVLGAVLGVLGTGMAWLFWPLPDARFDWRNAVQTYIETDQCGRLPTVLLAVARVDPEALTAFMGGRSISEICPVPPETENLSIFDGGFTTHYDNEIDQALLDSQFAEANLRRAPMGFRPAFDRLMWGRSLRRTAGLGWLGWPEIVLTMRCEYPLFWTRQATWYQERLYTGVFRGDGWELPGWEQRKAWCDHYANRQFQILKSSIGEVVSYSTDEDAARQYFLTQYSAWVIEWKRPEDMMRMYDQIFEPQP